MVVVSPHTCMMSLFRIGLLSMPIFQPVENVKTFYFKILIEVSVSWGFAHTTPGFEDATRQIVLLNKEFCTVTTLIFP